MHFDFIDFIEASLGYRFGDFMSINEWRHSRVNVQVSGVTLEVPVGKDLLEY